VNDDKSPVDQLLDVFVYAPIGLLFEGRTVFQQLVDKGRSQADMAKVVGKFAVQQGQKEAGKAVERLGSQAGDLLAAFAGANRNGAAPGTRSAASPARTVPTGPTPPTGTAGAASSGPPADSLAIPDYDSLSASQVVNRLAGLSTEELRAVRSYEGANRARKTILNKAAQLLGS
jgi:hypothetical protein